MNWVHISVLNGLPSSAPVAEPTNRLLPPELFHWFGVFGKGNAAAFDARGAPTLQLTVG